MHIHLKPEINIEELNNQEAVLHFPHKKISLRNFPLQNFQKKEVDESSSPEFFYLLEILKRASAVAYSLFSHEELLLTLIPNYNTHLDIDKHKEIDPNISLQISRFAYLKIEKDRLILKSPLLSGEIIFKHPKCLLLFQALVSPKNIEQLIQAFPEISKDAVHDFFSLLYQSHLLSNADQNSSLTFWEFHDLLFHTHSRQRTDQPCGGTFRFLKHLPPLPPLREIPSHTIPLFRPDLDVLMKSDPPFIEVMETRKSIREQGENPITKEQLGEFFYRVARVKETLKTEHYDVTKRPYPGGGACYELELYPLIHRCAGIEPGLYRYHGDIHALSPCPITHDEIEKFLTAAKNATGKKDESPQILILIAARFGRVFWKYETIAYSLILKNVGVLIQTMYLTATAMKLAPCAIGAGNSDHFAEIAKTNYYEETTVGEFMLGSIS